jgi:hypothetical protein
MAVVQGVVPVLLLVVRVVPMVMLLLLAMHVSCSSHVLVLHDTVSTRVKPRTAPSCLLLLVMVVVHLVVPCMVLLVVRMVRVVAVARSSSRCRRCLVRVVLLLVVQWVAPMRCRCKASTVTEPMGACHTRVAVVVVVLLPALVGVVTAAVGAIRCVALIRTPCCSCSSLVRPPLVAAIHLASGAAVPQRCMVLRVVLLLLVVVPIAAIQRGVPAIACSRCCCSVVAIRTHVLMLLRALLVNVKVTAAVAAIPGGCSCRSRHSTGRASCTTSAVGCRQLLVLDPTAAACKVVVLLLPLVVAAVETAPDFDRELCCCCKFILACHVIILRCQCCCCCMVLVPRKLRAEGCNGGKV